MEISVKEDKANVLLNRREIQLGVSYSGSTPNRNELKEEACKKLNADPALTVIHKINQLYGTTSSVVTLHIYSNKEAMKRFSKKKGAKGDTKKAKAAVHESTEADAARGEGSKGGKEGA